MCPGVTAGWRQVVYANSMLHSFTLKPSTAALKRCACNPIRLLGQGDKKKKKKKVKKKSFGPPTSR